LGYTMPMKKQYTPEFKGQVVKEILKEEKTMTQIAAEYGVHPVQLSQWKKMALDNLATVFVDQRKAVKQQQAQEQKMDRLYSQVGKLTTQLEWIKKKTFMISPNHRL
jgi:transposase-like protein